MSLNVSDTVSATSPRGSARSSAVGGDRFPKRPSGQLPEGADVVSNVKSLASEPDNRLMRAHPSASTADPLQRLPESVESGRQKSRTRKGAPEETPEPPDAQPRPLLQSVRCPYDPAPARQRDLDVLG
jgi:hypothetical protein